MENYISINNRKIELTDEQVAKMCDSIGLKLTQGIKLSDIPVGDTFWVGKYEFIVLERFEGTTAVVLKDCYGDLTPFGENNNFKNSTVLDICVTFEAELESLVGANNLVCIHTLDLTALDGRRDYGVTFRSISPLTLDRYRHYAEILDKYTLDYKWWLATPYSTATHDDSHRVCYVNYENSIDWCDCGDNLGIRPFCVLNSSITVDKQRSY